LISASCNTANCSHRETASRIRNGEPSPGRRANAKFIGAHKCADLTFRVLFRVSMPTTVTLIACNRVFSPRSGLNTWKKRSRLVKVRGRELRHSGDCFLQLLFPTRKKLRERERERERERKRERSQATNENAKQSFTPLTERTAGIAFRQRANNLKHFPSERKQLIARRISRDHFPLNGTEARRRLNETSSVGLALWTR